jgi:RHH-type proline utilization regulon transcriptional repressor/proline dehydrogenase/delta 1-pyrroline-5-carboxylate dehydrogenase
MGADPAAYEFQRLHGMGEALHDIVMADNATRCRIYAPVGAHRDLLAYLVRRLLENGANSSFVNQIVDKDVPPEEVAADPFAALARASLPNPALRRGPDLFPDRGNSKGWDLTDATDLAEIEAARAPHRRAEFTAAPIIAGSVTGVPPRAAVNPADPGDTVGRVTDAAPDDVETALAAARTWDAPAADRAAVLRRAAALYEADFGPIFAILAREAGKTLLDAVGELREAVDFLHYYAAGAGALAAPPCGTFACISPWNFPLAIFTGQIAAALAAGNAVIAKPAEQTPLIAALAVRLLHRAGVPETALQLLPGDGAVVGAALTSDARVSGVVFTGGTDTAHAIRRAMAENLAPGAPLIAETGGLNAMIMDSTALPEQAVRDVLASAFQSAGQRCSALRCLYVQEDISTPFTEMLTGAMDELAPGDPWELATDTGPVIDAVAAAAIGAHIEAARAEGRVLHQGAPGPGHAIPPTLIRVGGIEALEREIFGPVLHIAPFRAERIDAVIDAINATGYGLTFGLHSRIDDRVQQITSRVRVGNAYVNRNQIGAVVGSQPFGGEGLSGTGPKAGGPHYLARFAPTPAPATARAAPQEARVAEAGVQAALASVRPDAAPHCVLDLPGPTGESNRLSLWPRAPILCLGPGDLAGEQAALVRALGGRATPVTGALPEGALTRIEGFSAAIWWGDGAVARRLARELAARPGPILPLITGQPDVVHALLERHICIDTTAAGGNARLLAETGG